MPLSRFHRFKVPLMLALVVLSAALLMVLRGRSNSPAQLTIFLSGDSRGYLEPCGCRRDQAGGLPGRAAVIEKQEAASRLVFDAGNIVPGTRPYELLKTRYLTEGMAAIGYDAVNLGQTEAQLDLETLRQVMRDSHNLPFVSANVVDSNSKKPVVEPYRIIQRGKFRIGVTGVTSVEERERGPGLEVKPPLEALAATVPDLKSRCDFLIVLAFVNEDTIRNIAEKFHEVDCILGGAVPQSSNTAQRINRALVFNVTDHGKVLGKIDLKQQGAAYQVVKSAGIKIVTAKVGSRKDMEALIARYKDELRARRFELASAEGLERIQNQESTADAFAGDANCATCHAAAYHVTIASKHHHAFQTLLDKKSEYDPECLKCHTVGYGRYSGFVDARRTPQLANVQCESCHGRGKEHIKTMSAVLKSPTLEQAKRLAHQPNTLKSVTQSTCISCHDRENSENFNYTTFWPKIAHRRSWKNITEFWQARDKIRNAAKLMARLEARGTAP